MLLGEGASINLQVEDGKSMSNAWDRITEEATKPVEDVPAGAAGRWRVTVTDYFGGRGIDYRLSDEDANDAGGLMVIITSIPDSQREWVQWNGRTARQDKNGQISVLLHKEQDLIAKNLDEINEDRVRQDPEIIAPLLEKLDTDVKKKLAKYKDTLVKGSRINALCEQVYQAVGGSHGQW